MTFSNIDICIQHATWGQVWRGPNCRWDSYNRSGTQSFAFELGFLACCSALLFYEDCFFLPAQGYSAFAWPAFCIGVIFYQTLSFCSSGNIFASSSFTQLFCNIDRQKWLPFVNNNYFEPTYSHNISTISINGCIFLARHQWKKK